LNKRTGHGRDKFILMFFAFSLGLILSNLLSQSDMQEFDEVKADVLFVYKGVDKLKSDLSHSAQERLAKIDIERSEIITLAAIEQHIYQYASEKGITVHEAALDLFATKDPSEQQISDYFRQNSEKIDKPFFEVKEQLKAQLVKLKRLEAREHVLKDLIASGNLHFL